LEEIGGFPRKLTEDAYLTMMLAEKGFKIAYLSDTFIVEKAPKTFSAHLKQRLRWFQGYLECLPSLISRFRVLGVRSALLLLLYASPIAALFTTFSNTLFAAYWIAKALGVVSVSEFIVRSIVPPVFYWGLTLLVVGNLFLIYYILYTVADSRYRSLSPYVYLLPLYWFVNGCVAFVSFVAPRTWRKTVR
ncbi:MAG: glycosyltransferase, partial [Desulfurococcales archaeon]|nr:glycosyltransferase [Desulfurococcales archaeon]